MVYAPHMNQRRIGFSLNHTVINVLEYSVAPAFFDPGRRVHFTPEMQLRGRILLLRSYFLEVGKEIIAGLFVLMGNVVMYIFGTVDGLHQLL